MPAKTETTNKSTSEHKSYSKWIKFREDRSCTDDCVWVFTDGSTLGGYGAVVTSAIGEPKLYKGFTQPTKTRNVGAEMNGALLGLMNTPRMCSVGLVSDYLGVAAWLSGNWQVKNPEMVHKVALAHRIISDRKLTLRFLIHHGGHQTDVCDFTRFNNMADELATLANKEKPAGISLEMPTEPEQMTMEGFWG